MILFLDFDGVLHSLFGENDDGYFCRLPVLWEILRFPRFFVCQEATGFMLPASRAAVDSIH